LNGVGPGGGGCATRVLPPLVIRRPVLVRAAAAPATRNLTKQRRGLGRMRSTDCTTSQGSQKCIPE